MYTPRWSREGRVAVLQRAIETISFGTFVTSGKAGLLASHIPMMVERSEGKLGTIQGHIARGNNQWRDTDPGSQALAMFVGPDAYISPSWYQTHRDDGKVVPTWNYISVHASGRPVFFDEAERLLRFVTKLTGHFEYPSSTGCSVADSPQDYIASELKAIIGFEMPIESLEVEWKLGQNRQEADRNGAIECLRRRATGRDIEVSREMDAQLKGK